MFIVNSEYRIEYITEHVTEFLKYSREELQGKSIFNYIHHGDHHSFSSILVPMIRSSYGECGGADISRCITIRFSAFTFQTAGNVNLKLFSILEFVANFGRTSYRYGDEYYVVPHLANEGIFQAVYLMRRGFTGCLSSLSAAYVRLEKL